MIDILNDITKKKLDSTWKLGLPKSYRIGRFEIAADILFSNNFASKLYKVFGKMIPIKVDFVGYRNAYTYVAFSELFDEVKPNEEIPLYKIVVTEDDEVEAIKIY